MAERRIQGLQRVLGVNALASTAYGNVGSSIYYALGLVASFALGPHADRIRHHRGDLLPDRLHLLRGHRDVPGGRRVLQLRPACLQRVLVLLCRLGPDAQLHDHDRDLRVLRPALPRRAVLSRSEVLTGRRLLWHRSCGRAVRHQRDRRLGGGGAQRGAGHRRLLDAGAAGRAGRRAGLRPPHAGGQCAPWSGPHLEELPDRNTGGDDRLHRDRNDLQHGRGGQGRVPDDPQGDQPGGDRGVCHLRRAAGGGPVGAAGHLFARHLHHPAGRAREQGRLRRRPGSRDRQAPQPRAAAARRRDLRRPLGRHHPVHRHQRRDHRRLAAGVLDGVAPPVTRRTPPAAPQVSNALDRHLGVRSRRLPDDDPRARPTSWATCTRSARCCRSRSRIWP